MLKNKVEAASLANALVFDAFSDLGKELSGRDVSPLAFRVFSLLSFQSSLFGNFPQDVICVRLNESFNVIRIGYGASSIFSLGVDRLGIPFVGVCGDWYDIFSKVSFDCMSFSFCRNFVVFGVSLNNRSYVIEARVSDKLSNLFIKSVESHLYSADFSEDEPRQLLVRRVLPSVYREDFSFRGSSHKIRFLHPAKIKSDDNVFRLAFGVAPKTVFPFLKI